MDRVVSLVPSATETLLGWGVTPAAVTRFCEQPDLPTVGGTKDPAVEKIIAMKPDLVVMCPEENRLEDATRLRAAGVRVHAVRIDDVDGVAPALDELASALGLGPREVAPLPAPRDLGVRAFVPIWRRPWMTLGECYGSSVLTHVGLRNVVTDPTARYPTLDLEQLARLDVDVVLAPSEPYPFSERHRAELEGVAPVVFVDGKDLFWWGIRTPDALRNLATVADAIAPRRSC